MKRLLVPVLAAAALLPLHAKPIEADLGEGLRFHRAHALPAELPAPAGTPAPLVLDLRYATADAAAATALDGWIKFRATAPTPVLVLVNAETAAALRGVFAANQAQPGFVTIGIASADYTPDLVVATTAEADRRAYDALEQGGALTALLAENTDKPRYDEAAMMRERGHLPTTEDDADPDEFPVPEAPPAPAPASPPPTDAALQRAVQLHRSLLALKRLP